MSTGPHTSVADRMTKEIGLARASGTLRETAIIMLDALRDGAEDYDAMKPFIADIRTLSNKINAARS